MQCGTKGPKTGTWFPGQRVNIPPDCEVRSNNFFIPKATLKVGLQVTASMTRLEASSLEDGNYQTNALRDQISLLEQKMQPLDDIQDNDQSNLMWWAIAATAMVLGIAILTVVGIVFIRTQRFNCYDLWETRRERSMIREDAVKYAEGTGILLKPSKPQAGEYIPDQKSTVK